ncbi:MAG: hypothetical protein ACKOX7_00260 [Bacteroidota bacterium]
MIPNNLDASSKYALIHFKLLTRCFGVLSFLKYNLFSRDITDCIGFANHENVLLGNQLAVIRKALECSQKQLFDLRDIKSHLFSRFDMYIQDYGKD